MKVVKLNKGTYNTCLECKTNNRGDNSNLDLYEVIVGEDTSMAYRYCMCEDCIEKLAIAINEALF